jgi:hypothetical protein
MSIHQPQVWAAFHRESVSPIERTESDFLRMSIVYAEDDLPVYERWMRVLEYLPDMRGKHIYDDLTAIFEKVYRTGAGSIIAASIDLLMLRVRFFEMLRLNGIGRRHVNDYEIEASTVWRDKLLDRGYDVDPPKFRGGKYMPPETEAATKHRWLQ